MFNLNIMSLELILINLLKMYLHYRILPILMSFLLNNIQN